MTDVIIGTSVLESISNTHTSMGFVFQKKNILFLYKQNSKVHYH